VAREVLRLLTGAFGVTLLAHAALSATLFAVRKIMN
jgi:hypothetical protein